MYLGNEKAGKNNEEATDNFSNQPKNSLLEKNRSLFVKNRISKTSNIETGAKKKRTGLDLAMKMDAF